MNAETSKCVLLADRHYGVIEGIHGLLETTFATVVMVTDENSLIESASRLHPIVVVADLSLASGSGFGWLGRLLEQNAASKVIVLSVHDEPTVVQSALEAGASGYGIGSALYQPERPAEEVGQLARRLRRDSALRPRFPQRPSRTCGSRAQGTNAAGGRAQLRRVHLVCVGILVEDGCSRMSGNRAVSAIARLRAAPRTTASAPGSRP